MSPIEMIARGWSITDLPLGEEEAAVICGQDNPPALLPLLRTAAAYGYLLAAADLTSCCNEDG